MNTLIGRRALVTGGSRNLGAEIASRLASAGASVAVNFRTSAAEADGVVESLNQRGDAHYVSVRGDVADPSDAARIVEQSSEALCGPVDILVNNAGPYNATPFTELDEADFDRVWNSNAKATYLMSRAVAPGMKEAGWGRILNISASSGFVRNRSIYTLANKAVMTLTEELAIELAPEIVVNAVAPGQIYESLEELKDYIPDWAEQVIAQTPMGRLATRREIADIVVLLCSPAFSSVAGVTVPIDGGLSINTF